MHLKYRQKLLPAFTRVELTATLASVALLGTVGISVLASTAVRNDSAVCANNLRQVGRAFHMWASDHSGENPWWTSYTDGGSYIRIGGPQPPGGVLNVPGYGPMPAATRANAWVQFAYVGPELRTAAVLVCPTDRTKVRARDFSTNATYGYMDINFRNQATSYFIGAHGLSINPSSMLSGDRSLKEVLITPNCPVNMGPLSALRSGISPPTWNTDLHPEGGNILANDGRVEELSDGGLVTFFGLHGQSTIVTDFLKPQ